MCLEFEEKLSVIKLFCSNGTDRRPCGSRCGIRLDQAGGGYTDWFLPLAEPALRSLTLAGIPTRLLRDLKQEAVVSRWRCVDKVESGVLSGKGSLEIRNSANLGMQN